MIDMKLIYSEAHKARWTGIDYDERLGMASLAAVEAEKNWNPEKGALSTLIVTYIRNAFRSEVSRHQTRMKYDGIQASILTEDQIPEADSPNAERALIFRDQLARLPEDGKVLAALALRAPRGIRRGKNVLSGIQSHLRENHGWTNHRFQTACTQIREQVLSTGQGQS